MTHVAPRLTLCALTAASTLGLGLTASPAAAESVITFDDLTHGQIVDTEYNGVTINAVNFHRSNDLAVAFDTTLSNTADPDLEGTFTSGNLAGANLGRALIIQEKGQAQNGFVNRPDDEGRRPAGFFRFKFDQGQHRFGFDLIDIEGPEEFNQGYFLSFASQGSDLATVNFSELVDPNSRWYDSSIVFGNHSANRVASLNSWDLGIAEFDEVVIGMGGSGAVDNVRYSSAVPTPAALGTGLALLGGLIMRRRHRA